MGNVFRSVLEAARAAILQNKTVTAGTSNVTIQADSGYDGLDTVTVEPTPTEIGSATPTTSAQTITPSSGKHLASVNVGAIPSEYVIPTNITPSNSNPVSLSTPNSYKPTASGYAIASYSSVTPSNSSPVSLSSGTVYKMGGNGYAIASYGNVTPTSSVQTLSSGSIYKMNGTGYVYNAPVSAGYTHGWDAETTLWTNSSPTSSFGAQNVTLSQSIQNFNYIKIICRASTSVSTTSEAIYSKSFVLSCVSGNAAPRMALSTRTGSQSYVRIVNYASDTQIYFDTGHKRATSGDTNGYVIPTSIVGLK